MAKEIEKKVEAGPDRGTRETNVDGALEAQAESAARPDSSIESPQDDKAVAAGVEDVGADFFTANRGRLGYKSQLNVAVMKVLASLEREVIRESGMKLDGVRTEFAALQRRPSRKWEVHGIRGELIRNDYRYFLICLMMLFRRSRNRS